MLLTIDEHSTQSLHDQLTGQLRQAIASADLESGEKLPPARQLAESLSVNVHTVLRAFQTLRDEGLLEIRRGRGTMVTGSALLLALPSQLAKQLVDEARQLGLGNTEIRNLLEVHL